MQPFLNPWTTSVDGSRSPALDSLLKRRLSLLGQMSPEPGGTSPRLWWFAVALSGVVLLFPAVRFDRAELQAGDGTSESAAEEPKPKSKSTQVPLFLPIPSPKEAYIIHALDDEISFNYVEQPLSVVMDDWAEKFGIQFFLDKRALEDVGLDSEALITIELNGVRFRSALRMMLRYHGMAYSVEDDVLRISTQEELELDNLTRVYPVSDLCSNSKEHDLLRDTLSTIVAPESWDDVGGQGGMMLLSPPRSLVISQSYQVHEEILDLLTALRKLRDQR